MSLIDSDDFPGTVSEHVALLAAFGKDCDCQADQDGRFTHVCESHKRYAMDPLWGRRLVFERRLHDQLLREEGIDRP